MTLDDVLFEIEKAEKICIMAHENPDGDAIGSCLGFYLALKNMGKTNVEVLLKKVPDNFKYLPGYDDIKEQPTMEKFDLAIALDCADLKRIPVEIVKYFETADVKVNFDHHMSNKMYADYNIVNNGAPACAQILVESFDYLDIEITKDVMTCFLTGVITDTGGFKNSNISVDCFEIAERALEMGINLSKIYKQSLLMISRNKFKAQKLTMDRMEFFADGRICFTYITLEDYKNLELKDGDHEGIVEIGRNIEGVEVSIFLHEQENGFKISLRSNDYVNVSDVCSIFGGGGHVRAAGANTTMSIEEAKRTLVREIEKRLK